jgi:GH15 family glucan-1,4-alpha-glucosidase
MQKIFKIALETIEKNIGKNHSLIAALEGPGKEHKEYLHVWPRDAFFVALEISNFDKNKAKKIAEFVLNLPTENGLFYQRYEPDGKPDPNAWCNGDGNKQIDQDALRFVVLSKIKGLEVDLKKLEGSYLALLEYLKSKKPSVDVWEQKKGYFFYTTASLIWGIKSAQKIFGKGEGEEKILEELIKSIESFYDKNLKSFVKSPSERIIDLEVVLGLNILFECELEMFKKKENLEKVLSTLKAVEKELCVKVKDVKIPKRYKDDFWDGENISKKGSGRPWPMGCAFIVQAYCHVARNAYEIEAYEIALKALKEARRWFEYLRKIPNLHVFPEQVDFDGSLPKNSPKPLSWCAAEFIKAERIYFETKEKIRELSNIFALLEIYKPKLSFYFN